MKTIPFRTALCSCSFAFALTACADRSAGKPAMTTDTAIVAPDAPAPSASASDAPAAAAEPSATPRVTFRQTSYEHNAGEAFLVAASVFDAEGTELHDEIVRYSFDRGGMAWIAKTEVGSSCKDIAVEEHRLSVVARSGAEILVCGEQKGAEAMLHAEAMGKLSATTNIIVR